MKNFFLLLAAILLTVFTASAQIGNIKASSTFIEVYDYSGKRISTKAIQSSYETYLGSTSSFYCVMSKSGGNYLYIYDALGKRTGLISLNNGNTFANISGNTINIKSGSSILMYDSTGKYKGVQ